MKPIWTIARRELKAMFDHPTGYILLVVFLVVNDYLFFRSAYLNGVATLRPMLDLMPWILLFLVPAVTMRSLAEDLRSGTLEVVLAQPITEVQLLAGKYCGQVLFLWIAFALTIPVPLGLSLGADLPAGVLVAQYVGSGLLVAGLSGVGVFASSVTRNQITAFILAVAMMFPLILVGMDPVILGLPPGLSVIAQNLGVLSHFDNIARGVIDLRDVVYFATLAGVFLTFAYLSLMRRKLAHGGAAVRRLQLGTVLLATTLVVVNLFGQHIGGRLDLTPGRMYTLSPATKQILRNLDDLVTIKLFVSKELPTQVALLKRDVDDLLSDMQRVGGSNVRVVTLTPGNDSVAASDAHALGIPEIQFNVVGEAEFQVKSGFFGLAIQYADGAEQIPFIRETDDLEYRIAADIRSLTRTERASIGLLADVDPRDQGSGFQGLRQELSRQYDVKNLTANDTAPIPDDIKVLVLAGAPAGASDSLVAHVRAFVERGGSALVLARGMQIQQLMAAPFPNPWNRVLQPYGLSIRADLAYDLAANQVIQMPSQGGGVLRMAYPFWIRSLSTRAAAVNRDIESLGLPWASTIDWSRAPDSTVVPLFVTSRAGGHEVGRVFLSPQRRDFPQDSLRAQLVGVLVNPARAADSLVDSLPKGRLVVVGNSDFVSDRFARPSTPAMDFVVNAVDWLAEDAALIGIRSKARTPPELVFPSATRRDIAKYGNVVGVPLLLVLFGIFWLVRRRRLTGRSYSPLASQEVA